MTPSIKQRIEQIRLGEIPKGYVKTRVGVLPIQWETRALSSYLSESFVIGNTGNVAKKITVKLWNKGVVAKKEIHRGSENTRYYKRKKGQLIYSKLDFLNCAFGVIPESLDGFESTQDLPAFDIEGVDPVFLLSQIVQKRFYERWGTMVANGGRKARRISEDDFLSFPIAVPRIEEQRKIAAILTAQDKVIELKEQLLAEKQRQKAYLMQQLLTGKKRLTGVGEEWKIKPLKKVTEKQTKKNNGFQYRLVLSNSAQHGIVSQDQEFDKEIANEERIDGYYVVIPGAFVYNPRISVTAPCGPINVNETGETGVMSPLYTVFTISSPQISQDFLKYYFQSSCWYKYVKGVANYGARHDRINISDDDFFDMPIPLPTKEEQNYVAKVLSTADREIELLQQDIGQEKQKKKALMHLLLTGIVRVDESY